MIMILPLAYRRAHEQYLADRERLESVPEIAGVSAGGMPDRVKCLHALVAHSLAAGEGVNPLGDEAVQCAGRVLDSSVLGGDLMTRVAAIDCGTNSIRLLIAEPDGSGGLNDLERRLEIVRLGQGVDATGEFHPDALRARSRRSIEYAELIKKAEVPVEKVHFVATSAARDAKNRDSFFARHQGATGCAADVISGETEARLSFIGALSRVTPDGEPVLVMDIGGGSTELITGSAAGELHSAISLDIGSVRVTERFLKQNPVADDDLARATDVRRRACWRAAEWTSPRSAPGSGSPVQRQRWPECIWSWSTTTASGCTVRVIPLPAMAELLHRLARMTVEEIRALPSMHPGRADVITGGALVEARIAARLQCGGPDRQRVRHSRWDCPAAPRTGDTMPR